MLRNSSMCYTNIHEFHRVNNSFKGYSKILNKHHFQRWLSTMEHSVQVHILHTSEMIEAFQCTKEIRSRYKFSQIRPAMKPLAISSKVSIRSDEDGLLCLQFMIQTEAKQLCYIEYFCTPVVDLDD